MIGDDSESVKSEGAVGSWLLALGSYPSAQVDSMAGAELRSAGRTNASVPTCSVAAEAPS